MNGHVCDYVGDVTGGERARSQVQQPADERGGALRRDAGDRLHPCQRADAEHVDDSTFSSHGYIPEFHRRL